MTIKVLKPGMFSTIQDVGRFGHQHDGFATAGVMDIYSYRLGQTLIGNNGPAIEFTQVGPTLQFNQANTFVIAGPRTEAKLNGHIIPHQTVIQVRRGDQLEVGQVLTGMRGYILFGYPMSIDDVADSVSTHTRTEIGGLTGHVLQKGDILPIDYYHEQTGRPGQTSRYRYDFGLEEVPIHILEGPQIDAFSQHAIDAIVSENFEISSASDRMGYRLNGPSIAPNIAEDMISEPVALGSIQVPNDGQPIILLHDRQTVGGYVKIATVSRRDVARLAQMKPGTRIRFTFESVSDATYALRKVEYEFERVMEQIRQTPRFHMSYVRNAKNNLMEVIQEEY